MRAPAAGQNSTREDDDDTDAGKTSVGGNAAWAAIGFICGAVCWHFIGFWGFLTALVLKGPAETQGAASHMHCITLVIDRATGLASSETCPELIAMLPSSPRNYRGAMDNVPSRRRIVAPATTPWSITVSNVGDGDASEQTR